MWFPLFAKNRCSAPHRRPSFRPRLEALEDRRLMSAGALDPTFGASAGYVSTSLSSGGDTGRQVLVQPSGNIVVAGSTGSTVTTTSKGKTTTTTEGAFGMATYNPDGSLDTSFGSGGVARQVFQNGGAYLYGAALEPMGPGDAKIVLAGNDAGQVGLALMRLNANGSLDATFGGGGQVVTAFNKAGVARAVAVTGGGQIVAAGDDDSNGKWLIARYAANGSLDPTFGSGGQVATTFTAPGGGVTAMVHAVAPQPDGKLVVVGIESWLTSLSGTSVRTYQGIVVRYNANGSLDATFGSGGIANTAVATGTASTGTITRDFGVAIYPIAGTTNDGKIVVVGNTGQVSAGGGGTVQALVERYNPDGSLDTTFGGGAGYVTIGSLHSIFTAGDAVTAVGLASDGKLILAGEGSDSASLVARLNPDGSLDASFGNGGLVSTAIGAANPNGQTSQFDGLAIQSDGRIVAAGTAYVGGKYDFAVARYLPSEPQIGLFTASTNPVTAGGSETLTASNITDGNPGETVAQVTFYYYDGAGAKQALGYGTQTSPGVWTLNYTVNLASGSYTLYAQAQDSDGVFGDPLAATLQVM
jgi:uncharacterized delta-60 repeat protein